MKRSGIIGGLLLGAIIASCTAEPIAANEAAGVVTTAFCDQVFDCTCLNSAGFTSREACYATVFNQLIAQQAEAVGAGLWYDDSCVHDAVDFIHDAGCSRQLDSLTSHCDDCFTYHGGVAAGEPCYRVGPYSTCIQGHACVPQVDNDGNAFDICLPVCELVGNGQPCKLNGPNFTLYRLCNVGLVCDANGTGLCVPLPGPAQACWDKALCHPEAWCDPSTNPPICAKRKGLSEGCTTDVECSSGWCREAARCENPFPPNSPCAADLGHRCQPGHSCIAGFCQPDDAAICMSAPPQL